MHTMVTETDLLQTAHSLAGRSLHDIAKTLDIAIPHDFKRNKGFVGQLIEDALGADAGNLDEPDFVSLGIELKTIPMSENGIPLESPYICYANLPPSHSNWDGSRLERKTRKMLWVPYQGERHIPIAQKQLGMPFLWQRCQAVNELMQQDYFELVECALEGRFDEMGAQKGQIIQLRPKAANSKHQIHVTDSDGEATSTVPKGFYFRRAFLAQLFRQFYLL